MSGQNSLRRMAVSLFCLASLSMTSCSMPDVAGLWVPREEPLPSVVPVSFERNQDSSEKASREAEKGNDDKLDAVTSPLVIGIRDAALLALQHNPAFQTERLQPAIRQSIERQERAAFDPLFSADVSIIRADEETDAETGNVSSDLRTGGRSRTGGVGLQRSFPTGTTVGISARRTLGDAHGNPENASDYDDLSSANDYDITVTQAL